MRIGLIKKTIFYFFSVFLITFLSIESFKKSDTIDALKKARSLNHEPVFPLKDTVYLFITPSEDTVLLEFLDMRTRVPN